MENSMKIDISQAEAEKLQNQIEECLAQMRRLRIILDNDQEIIDQLKEENRQNLAEIRKLVA